MIEEDLLTSDEAAAILKVEPSVVEELISREGLRAFRVGQAVRISACDLREWLKAQTIGARVSQSGGGSPARSEEPANVRFCRTSGGRSKFRVRGFVTTGAEIWPGKTRSPLRFSAKLFHMLLREFGGQEVRIGGAFDRASDGSLGQWIQDNLPTKMNPAVYVAGFLIAEGFAVWVRPGFIKILEPKRGLLSKQQLGVSDQISKLLPGDDLDKLLLEFYPTDAAGAVSRDWEAMCRLADANDLSLHWFWCAGSASVVTSIDGREFDIGVSRNTDDRGDEIAAWLAAQALLKRVVVHGNEKERERLDKAVSAVSEHPTTKPEART